jgi:hypothetical protein
VLFQCIHAYIPTRASFRLRREHHIAPFRPCGAAPILLLQLCSCHTRVARSAAPAVPDGRPAPGRELERRKRCRRRMPPGNRGFARRRCNEARAKAARLCRLRLHGPAGRYREITLAGPARHGTGRARHSEHLPGRLVPRHRTGCSGLVLWQQYYGDTVNRARPGRRILADWGPGRRRNIEQNRGESLVGRAAELMEGQVLYDGGIDGGQYPGAGPGRLQAVLHSKCDRLGLCETYLRAAGTLYSPDRPGFYGTMRGVPRTGWASGRRHGGRRARRQEPA